MIDQAHLLQRVKEILIRELRLPISPDELDAEEMLFDGYLGMDSRATMFIVAALEAEFGIIVLDQDVSVELFETARGLTDYIVQRLQAAPQDQPLSSYIASGERKEIIALYEQHGFPDQIPADYLERDFILLLSDLQRGDRVLDVACGNGFIALEMARRHPGSQVVGVDLAPRLVREAAEKAAGQGLTNAHFFVGEGEDLAVSGPFDVILCRFVAHFFQNLETFVEKCARLLAPNGRFILSVAAAPQEPLAYELVNVLYEGFIPSFIHFYSEPEFLAMIERAGLRFEWLVRRQAWEFDKEQNLHDNWANLLKQRGLAPQEHPFQEAIPWVLIISARRAN